MTVGSLFTLKAALGLAPSTRAELATLDSPAGLEDRCYMFRLRERSTGRMESPDPITTGERCGRRNRDIPCGVAGRATGRECGIASAHRFASRPAGFASDLAGRLLGFRIACAAVARFEGRRLDGNAAAIEAAGEVGRILSISVKVLRMRCPTESMSALRSSIRARQSAISSGVDALSQSRVRVRMLIGRSPLPTAGRLGDALS